MQYFNDILNVYAYLRTQAQACARDMGELAHQALQLHGEIEKTSQDIQSLERDADAFLQDAMALADKMGVDITDLLGEEAAVSSKKPSATITETGRIQFPQDCNFAESFENLVREAHAAGFTDVHPEQLLTDEEMANAEVFSQQLDAEFARTTRLQGNDIAVLMIAVVVRVSFYYLGRFLTANAQTPDQPGAQPNTFEELVPDASRGVDIGKVLQKNLSGFAMLTNTHTPDSILAGSPEKGFMHPLPIRTETRILKEHTSFDVDTTELLSKDQIIGYDKHLGWVFGVFNLLTDTVTTRAFKSYSVARLPDETAKPLVDQEVSTLFQLIIPTIQSMRQNHTAVIASVVREATELGIANASKDSVLELFQRSLALERQTSNLVDQSRMVLPTLWQNVDMYLNDIALNSLLNTIIAAIHSMMYQAGDAELSRYALRTRKIILYSGMLATVANSIPALLQTDLTKIDLGGLISALLSSFHSTAFWIQVKTEFLVNTYRNELSSYLEQLNQEFDFV